MGTPRNVAVGWRWAASPTSTAEECQQNDSPAPIIGTQDDNASYGATFDALNIWELSVKWRANPVASIVLKTQLPVAGFDSIFLCAPGLATAASQDRPSSVRDNPVVQAAATFASPYRTFATYESLVTQSVEASPGVAGRVGTRSGGPVAPTACTSRVLSRRVMASIVGWVASRRTKAGIWLSATAW